jgi:hypothetical protein
VEWSTPWPEDIEANIVVVVVVGAMAVVGG